MQKKLTKLKKRPIGSFNYKIGYMTYKIFLYDSRTFKQMNPGAEALNTGHYSPEMHFHPGELNISIVRHELMHAYIANTNIEEIEDLSVDGFEEVVCEIVAKGLDSFIEDANEIYKQLLSIKREHDATNKQPS